MQAHARRPLDTVWLFCIGAVLPLLAAWLLGADANWDLRNYHLYNPHAWLTGRWMIDVGPAQVQSWHSPLLDVPFYLIIRSHADPRLASLWAALPVATAMLVLLRMQRLLCHAPPSRISQLALVLLALTGAATYSTLGTSTNDSFVAAGILGSLLCALQARPGTQGRWWLCAGLLAGATTGLKLSAAFYCIGLAVAALVHGAWDARGRLSRLAALAAGGMAGFAIAYAYWGVRLYQLFGNPFFPYFNNVFKSPGALPLPYADARFRPESLFDALASPVRLLSRSHRFSELALSDPRLLLGIVSLGLGCLLLARRREQPLRSGVGFLFVFVLVSWLLWIFQYGIYRYAIVLELLGALGLVLFLARLPRCRDAAMLAAVLLVSADTKRPDYGRLHAPPPRLGIPQLPVGDDAMVVVVGTEPVAYLALGLPDRVPMVSVGSWMLLPPDCTGLQARAAAAIRAQGGPIWLLRAREDPGARDGAALVADRYGLKATGGQCVEPSGPLGSVLLCPLRHGAALGSACAAGVSLSATAEKTPACTQAGISAVHWRVAAPLVKGTTLQVWVASPAAPASPRLFAEGGLTGDARTGAWDMPGTVYFLREKSSGKVLATVSSDRRACPGTASAARAP